MVFKIKSQPSSVITWYVFTPKNGAKLYRIEQNVKFGTIWALFYNLEQIGTFAPKNRNTGSTD